MTQLSIAIRALVVLSVLTGLAYPLALTAVAQALLPHQANGSLIQRNGRVAGSLLIGQSFDDPKYFWGRLSATTPPYNGATSSGSNLGPLHPALVSTAQQRLAALRQTDPENTEPVPVDLVTASGSGLDPHISLAAAQYQIERVVRVRGLPKTTVQELVFRYTRGRTFSVLGEPVVNVLVLNLALDDLPTR